VPPSFPKVRSSWAPRLAVHAIAAVRRCVWQVCRRAPVPTELSLLSPRPHSVFGVTEVLRPRPVKPWSCRVRPEALVILPHN